jgi:8-oxo-dGTP diphosphatase
MMKVGANLPKPRERHMRPQNIDQSGKAKVRRGDTPSEGSRGYRNPTLTVDGIVLIDGKIVLVRRGRDPHKGEYALPGGIVEYGETVEKAIVREVEEETGLKTDILEIVGLYSGPLRDPRGHFISICFHLQRLSGDLKGGDDAETAVLYPLDRMPEMAFDHADMIRDFLDQRTFLGH